MTSTPDTAPAHTAKDGKGILITEPAMQQLAKLVVNRVRTRCCASGCGQGVAAA